MRRRTSREPDAGLIPKGRTAEEPKRRPLVPRFAMTRWPGARIAGAVIVVSLVLAALALSYSPLVSHDKISVLLPSGVVTIIVGLGVTRLRSWRRGLDILEPPVFISLWCLSFYVLPTVSWALGLTSIRLNPVISDDPTYWISMSCWLTAVGLGLIWIGYVSVTKRKQVNFRPPVQNDPALGIRVAMVLYSLSIAIRFYLYTYGLRGNAGYFRAYFEGGSATVALDQVINVVVKCLAATGPAIFIYALSRPRPNRLTTWLPMAVLIVESLLGVLSGSRAGIILNLLFFAAYYRYSKGRYPSWRLVPGAILIFLLSIPVINQIRSETIDPNKMTPGIFLKTFQTASREVIDMPPEIIIREVLEVSFDRQMYVFQLQAAIMRLHPDILPYKGIGQLASFPLQLVPRALWPEKPILFDALEATRIYAEDNSLVFSSPVIPAELYSLAGWPTVVFGMFVFGVIQGLAYKLLVGPGKALPLVLFTMIYSELSHWEGHLSGILAVLLRSIPLFWLFLSYVLFRKTTLSRHAHIQKGGRVLKRR